MKLSFEETLAVFLAGIIAGLTLAWIERTFPSSGVTRL